MLIFRRSSFSACLLLLLSYLLLIPGCPRGGDLGPYFLYGLRWGMEWQEVREVLKLKKVELNDIGGGEKEAKAPFFIAGVSGTLTLTFKKRFLNDPALKGFRYEADIQGPDIRAEAYLVAIEDLQFDFGEPTEKGGTVEDESAGDTPADPYFAIWRHPGGDVTLTVTPAENRYVLDASANTEDSNYKWLK